MIARKHQPVSQITKPDSDVAHLMRLLCPEVISDLNEFWHRPLRDYARHLFRPVPRPVSTISKQASNDFLLIIGPALDDLGFNRCPILQTGLHHQLFLDSYTFFALLFTHIGAQAAGLTQFAMFTSTTVTLETRSRHGPGWINIGGTPVNLFGLSRRVLARTSVLGAPPVAFDMDAIRLEASRSDPSTQETIRRIERLGWAERQPAPFAAQISAANADLYASWSQSTAAKPPFAINDRDVATLLNHHLMGDGICGRLLFDERRREKLKKDIGFCRQKEMAGSFLPSGSDFFWRVRGGRIRQLKDVAGCLRDPVDPDWPGVRLRRPDLIEPLSSGEIVPDLFLIFLLLAILPRVRVLGGMRQIAYLPLYQKIFVNNLDLTDHDERELANELNVACLQGWGMRVMDDSRPITQILGQALERQELARVAEEFGDVKVAISTDGLSRFASGRSKWRSILSK